MRLRANGAQMQRVNSARLLLMGDSVQGVNTPPQPNGAGVPHHADSVRLLLINVLLNLARLPRSEGRLHAR